MEIHEYNADFYKIYNPIAGDTILDVEFNEETESFIASWMTDVFEEPTMNNRAFEEAWFEFSSAFENDEENEGASPDCIDLIKFLTEYENPEWKVFEITSSGMACGPLSSTSWIVAHKDSVFEEVEDEDYDSEEYESDDTDDDNT